MMSYLRVVLGPEHFSTTQILILLMHLKAQTKFFLIPNLVAQNKMIQCLVGGIVIKNGKLKNYF